MGVRDAFGGSSPLGFKGVGVALLLCSLAPSERYATERGKRHKPLTERAWQLLLLVRRWQPERRIAFCRRRQHLRLFEAPRPRCSKLANPIIFVTRLRLDAALYEAAPPRYPGQIGRPRLKGDRLANLSTVAEDCATAWKAITVDDFYGESERTVEVVSGTALWYSTGLPAVPLRWVLIRDPREQFETQALLCTELAMRNPSRSSAGS